MVVKLRVGAAPADTDPSISQGICYWDGTSALSIYSITSVVASILVDTGTLDTSIDNMKKRFGHWA